MREVALYNDIMEFWLKRCLYFIAADRTQVDVAVQNLMEMGYEEEEVLRAMNRSYADPDRAAEYLMTVSNPCPQQN